MGLFDWFKSKPATSAENETAESELSVESRFAILRDDGVRALKMGEAAYAVRCFTAALELQDDLETLSFLAEAQYRMQDYAAAEPSLRKLAEAQPENLNVLLLLARTLSMLSRHAEMKSVCENVLTLLDKTPENEPWQAVARYHLADAHFHLDNPFQAIAEITLSLQLRSEYAEARLLRARILASMEQWNEALEDTSVLVEQTPENEDALLLHAQALAALVRNAEAESVFKQLLELNPFHRGAVVGLVGLYERMSRLDFALEVCNEAIELTPDFAEAYTLRGAIRLRLHDKMGAADDMKKGLELNPQQAAQLDGEFTNAENRMNECYRNLNPYGF